jgi:hypothetical protein
MNQEVALIELGRLLSRRLVPQADQLRWRGCTGALMRKAFSSSRIYPGLIRKGRAGWTRWHDCRVLMVTCMPLLHPANATFGSSGMGPVGGAQGGRAPPTGVTGVGKPARGAVERRHDAGQAHRPGFAAWSFFVSFLPSLRCGRRLVGRRFRRVPAWPVPHEQVHRERTAGSPAETG